MEIFNKAQVVRIKSHLNKYLIAGDDEETVRQSKNGSSLKSRWRVELVEGNSRHVIIRLKSCHGLYLTASDEPFRHGTTGKKVVQTIPANRVDYSVEWEPINVENGFVKLKTSSKDGDFLRANGGTLPWRNTITHGSYSIATQGWVLWEVDVIDMETTLEYSLAMVSYRSGGLASCRQSGREYFFDKAKVVRLKSHHGKFLVADDDEQTVQQSPNGSSHKARWTVEFVAEKSHVIRLKSCHGRYLTASDKHFLTGMTGKKVVQTIPATETDTSTEWEPIKEGISLKLRTKKGKFLRANGGTPPWRNSITHDVPDRTATQNWVLWGVDVVDILLGNVSSVLSFSSFADDFPGSPDTTGSLPMTVFDRSQMKSDGQIIYYSVVDDDDGKSNDDAVEGTPFNFKGTGLEELIQKLEEETGIYNIIVCSRNPENGKLIPLPLDRSLHNDTMHVFIVPPSSKSARDFWPETHNST